MTPNYHSPDLDKVGQTAKWQFGDSFTIQLFNRLFSNQLNGNSVTVLLPFGHSDSNSNANGTRHIQNAHDTRSANRQTEPTEIRNLVFLVL